MLEVSPAHARRAGAVGKKSLLAQPTVTQSLHILPVQCPQTYPVEVGRAFLLFVDLDGLGRIRLLPYWVGGDPLGRPLPIHSVKRSILAGSVVRVTALSCNVPLHAHRSVFTDPPFFGMRIRVALRH